MPSTNSKRDRQSTAKRPESESEGKGEKLDINEKDLTSKVAHDNESNSQQKRVEGMNDSGGKQPPQKKLKKHRMPGSEEATKSSRQYHDDRRKDKRKEFAVSMPSVTNTGDIDKTRIEMHFLHKGKKIKMKLFANDKSAIQETGISYELVAAVCDEGGGFLGGNWFQFERNNKSAATRDRKMNATSAQLRTKEFFQGGVTFDMSQLRPLEGKDMSSRQWWKRVIELVCKRTGHTPVCFPSVRAAAAALGTSADQVVRACNTYATAEQYSFINFYLRYKMDSTARLYGSSKSDFRDQESFGEAADKNLKTTAPKVLTSSKLLKHRRHHQFETTKEVFYQELDPNSPIVVEAVQVFNDRAQNGSASPRSNDLLQDAATEDGGLERLCVFCQDNPSEIIFEPCGHSVICENCASWACRLFCPRCRTRISKRRRTTSLFRGVKLDLGVKPRTFSAYSFMDFSS